MERYWDSVKQIINESDIVLEIVDARAAEMSRNEQLEKLIKESGRPKIIVINKADLVNRNFLEAAIESLSKDNEYVVYVSDRRRNTIKNLLAKIRQIFAKHGKRPKEIFDKFTPNKKREHREAKGDIVIGVVGYPNVGKSSIINALSFKKKAKVSTKAGTTHGIHWITASKEIKLIDTPGVIPFSNADDAKLGFFAARSPEKLKDPELVAGNIIELFKKNNMLKKLEEFYNVKIENPEANQYEIIEEIGRKKSHLKKGGVVDEARTSIIIVRDWQNGKLKL